ncbi:hypothetical protein EON83_12375 [bacterium]|nr:MAG: hypothetical protein EON83_12375 [bacterium]
MKHLISLLTLMMLAGCAQRPAKVSTYVRQPPPKGMVRIADSGRGTPEGTVIYNNVGGILGTVVAFDGNHRFPGGTVDVAVGLSRPGLDETQWYSTHIINQFFLPKNP